MNLLIELLTLTEKPARVHVNGHLTVLADLIEKEFGQELSVLPVYHKCLIAQVAYILKARTSMTMTKILDMVLAKYIKLSQDEIDSIGTRGTTPDQLIKIFDKKKVVLDGKAYRMHCSFHMFSGVQELISAVKAGHPVLVPFNVDSDFSAGTEGHDEEGRYARNKEEFYTPPDDHHSARHHVLLAVGVDEESKEIILRDTRDEYLHKGYVKAPYDVVDVHAPKTFTIDVNMVEE